MSVQRSERELKACCAALYAGDWARLLLGESHHPGGLALTERLGALLGLDPATRLLDVAAGGGASALYLARRFRCPVVGLDYGAESVARARDTAAGSGLAHRVRFLVGDAEALGLRHECFDAVLCECALCTFPDKRAAARELARVLRPGGLLGLSDLTRSGPLPAELEGLLGWVACLADARPLEDYAALLAEVGLVVERIERHDDLLARLVADVRHRLAGAELLLRLQRAVPEGLDWAQARRLGAAAAAAVEDGTLGYALLLARKPA